MGNIIRFYNQNRRSIWIFLVIIFFLFILLQTINYLAGTKQKNKTQEVNNINVSNEENNNIEITSNKSVVSGNALSTTSLKKDTDTIEKFLNYCNNQKIEEAYNMLTDECKEELYPAKEDFKTYYYGDIFNGEKIIFEVENWINDTYKVDIVPDMLSTGKSNNGFSKQDYITVKKVNDEYKLNINNYIGRQEIKVEKEIDNVKIKVNYKDVYKEYEKYNLTVENSRDTAILLDDLNNIDSMYLTDKNDLKYSAYTHELTKEMLKLSPKENKEIEIKFYSSFVSTKKIRSIVFSKFINYSSNKEENSQKVVINL